MIWLESTTNVIYQGTLPLVDLSPLERNLLLCFLENPGINLTKSQLIEATWPPDVHREGVSDDSLFRLIRSLRGKLSFGLYEKYDYVINWRGYPEGGYRFQPSGQEALTAVSDKANQHQLVLQLNRLQRLISNQKETIMLLEEIVEGFADRLE